jgi:hypothetical protein
VLSEILTAVRQLDDDSIIGIMTELAPILPESLLPEAVSIAGALSIHHQRRWLLGGLADHLPPALVGEALATAQTLGHDFGRTQLLGEVLAHQPDGIRDNLTTDALSSARAITSAYNQVVALIELSDHMPSWREQLLSEALSTARRTTDIDRAQLVATLAPLLRPEVLREAAIEGLVAARQISDPYNRARALAFVIPHLPDATADEARQEAVAAARAVTPAYLSGLMLAQLAVVFTDDQRGDVLQAGLDLLQRLPKDGGPAARLTRNLARIASHLPKKPLLDIIDIVNISVTADERTRAELITNRALRYLRMIPNRLLAETIAVVHVLPGSLNVTGVLGPLAVPLPEPLREMALTEAITTARRTRLARRRVLQQAAHMRVGQPTTEDIALVRRCLDNTELNDCLSVLAAAVPTIKEAASDDTLLTLLESIGTVERWWYPTADARPSDPSAL